jgi:hypothetical protein
VTVYSSILSKGQTIEHNFVNKRRGYIHLVQSGGDVIVNDEITLQGGDGLFITETSKLKIQGASDKDAEFVLFDLADEE